ncbi:hypothetical protein B0H13DRAFT_1990390 [Mycena leptocephala]|nr:hypothetical protein B0H13DRAFT_1990390 [Mycena leptocephala]
MNIVFSPALGEMVHVSAGTARKPTTQLRFTATLMTATDYEQVASGRVKLQVWSDIPGGGRNAGEWGETDFKPVPTLHPLNETGFSLVPVDNQPDETSLAVDFSVPLSDGQRFSFTYRMVYPTGETKWLGQYGQNGSLVLDRAHDPVFLGEDWVPTPEDHCYRRNSDEHAAQDLEAAKLSRPSDYTAYPVPEDSFLYPKDSPLIVLLPRLSSQLVIMPPTLVFAASPSGSISFTHRGTITMSGTPSLSFTACESPEEAEAAVSRVINHCSPRCRVVTYTPGVLVLASAVDKYPIEVAIIPIASSSPRIQSSLTLQSLTSLIPGQSPFFMFSFPHRNARFFPPAIGEALDERISLTAGQFGGQFVLSPALTVNYGSEEQWRVGIMSSYSSPSLPAPAEGLPTPPPSPRLRPLTHRMPEIISQSPDPSFLSLPAAISTDDQTPSGSSSQLVVHSKRRNGVLAVIGHIFMVLLTWITGLFRRPRPKMQSRRITDERTPLLQDTSHAQPRVEVSIEDNVQQASSSRQPDASGISVDIGSGETTLLFHTAHPTSSFDVPIQLNGRNADINVHKFNDELFVVDFSSSTGGSLKIG